MRRVLCGVLLLALGLAPVVEARSRVQLSKKEQRRRYVAKPLKIKKFKKPPKAPKNKWARKR
jgi:hypothetical protein